MNKKNISIYIFTALLLVLFVLGLTKVYEKGFIEGGRTICKSNHLDLGVDENGNFICYNPNKEETLYLPYFGGEAP